MKRITLFVLFICALLAGCSKLTECEQIESRQAIMLIDVTDRALFDEIKSDLDSNLPVFMQKTGLAEISSCERFTISMVPITSKQGMHARSESIGITRKGQSYHAERQQADPAPLVNLIRTELTSYESMTNDQQITSGSNIANIILKALSQTDNGSHTTLIVFSDMIENNDYLNMYRYIPDSSEMQTAINNLIDPIGMDEFNKRQAQGLNSRILIVCKENPLENVDTSVRDVRAFWRRLFDALKVPNVEFLDNLSNVK